MQPEHKKLLTLVAYGDIAEIKSVFDEMDCSFSDAKGQNVLFPAIAKKRGLSEYFLDRGASINQQNIDGNTPLHLSAANMDLDACRILLDRGADTSLTNKWGNQPLWVALLEAIKVVNQPKGYEMLEALLAHNADPGAKNAAGQSPRTFCEINVTDQRIRSMFLTK